MKRSISFYATAFFALATGSVHAQPEQTAPLLVKGPTSQSYELVRIATPYLSNITFLPGERFFLVQERDIVKFDARGREVFRLTLAGDHHRSAFSPFVVSPNGVLDLREADPQIIPFRHKVNAAQGRSLSRAEFLENFQANYDAAEIMVLGERDDAVGKQATYLRIGGDWVLYYLTPRAIKTIVDHELGNSLEGFPEKFPRMNLLKSKESGLYSFDRWEVREGNRTLPERLLSYPEMPRLTLLSYNSEYVSEQIPYTPIPSERGGPAFYSLTIGGEDIRFWEMATRRVLRTYVNTNMNLFVLPDPLGNQVPVSFLEFRPGNNFNTAGSEGLYILRPRN